MHDKIHASFHIQFTPKLYANIHAQNAKHHASFDANFHATCSRHAKTHNKFHSMPHPLLSFTDKHITACHLHGSLSHTCRHEPRLDFVVLGICLVGLRWSLPWLKLLLLLKRVLVTFRELDTCGDICSHSKPHTKIAAFGITAPISTLPTSVQTAM